jgi:hypothetical protein
MSETEAKKEMKKPLFSAELIGELTFFVSVSNVIFSTWVISVMPWKYWMFHSFKNILYTGHTYMRNVAKGWQWFLADFCYVVNYLSFLYFGICYLKANFPAFAFLRPYLDPYGVILFRIAFIWSTGVLATSVGLFTNSFVFHSPQHMAILAIHIGPPLVVWSMRWWVKELHADFPDTFHIGCNNYEECGGSLFELVGVSCIAYIALWTIPYSAIVFIFKEKSIKEHEYVTMFSYYKDMLFPPTGSVVQKMRDNKVSEQAQERVKQAMYMSTHGILCFISFFWAYLCYYNFWIHTGFLIILTEIAIWNGATFYFKVAMNKERILKQEVKRQSMKQQQILEAQASMKQSDDAKMK